MIDYNNAISVKKALNATENAIAAGETSSICAKSPEDAELDAWLAKYTPVERAIFEAREKRAVAKARRKYETARRFGDICEITDGAAARWRRDGFFKGEELWLALAGDAGYWEYARFVDRAATKRINRLRGSLLRPRYYKAENERRRALAAERRKIRERRTVNECPTKEEILDAWSKRKTSHEAAIRFGSLLEDLECYVDNSLRFDEDGAIVGRNGGIKSWLRENIPALALVYSSVMRYKAAAKKFRQIAGMSDPMPAVAMLDAECDYDAENSGRHNGEGGETKRNDGDEGQNSGDETRNGGFEVKGSDLQDRNAGRLAERDYVAENEPTVEVVRARAIWLEIGKTAGKSVTSLFERLDALTDPERIEDANMLEQWRRKYETEITLRNRRRWWKKLLRGKTA